MTEKELKHLSRKELLEILCEMKRVEEGLRRELAEVKEKLEKRELIVQNAGSIAEAAMTVNQIFEAAQSAADDYLNSLKAVVASSDEMVEDARQKAQAIIAEAEEKAKNITEG